MHKIGTYPLNAPVALVAWISVWTSVRSPAVSRASRPSAYLSPSAPSGRRRITSAEQIACEQSTFSIPMRLPSSPVAL